ncbi:MAG: hypothetical protein R3242_02790, partial [Akkermansiaceae bacterium]|nr:hypothetical protein [Akkermansiaceae bacterium]
LWVGAIVTEFYGKPLCRHPMAYLIFPMGFLVLFSFRISMFFLTVYQNHAARRGVDYDTQVDEGMMLARSLIVIGSAAALSLLSAVIVMLCRGKTKN